MKVIKRDGREVEFDKIRIVNAILKASEEVHGEISNTSESMANHIADSVELIKKDLSVEEIQDIVEESLMIFDKAVAKAYIKYRYDRSKVRERNMQLMRDISDKIDAKNVQNQNANVDEKSFGGRTGEATDTLMKKYALEYCMSEMSRNNHLNNEIYIHDLNSYTVGSHNCLTIPFDKLLANGFNTRQTDVRPAQSVSTAFQLVAVIFQIQSLQQFGGVSASHLDWTMLPYVRKSFKKYLKLSQKYIEKFDDKFCQILDSDTEIGFNCQGIKDNYPKSYQYAYDMTEREVIQAVEGMYHNLNTLQSRSGNQLPFTSVNYGTCTEPEGRMVTKALLDVSIKGIGKLHKTSIFPCGIFQMMDGVNRHKGDPNYDLYRLALKSTSQRLYPNYCNCNWSGNEGFDKEDPKTYFSTMGKRKLQLM